MKFLVIINPTSGNGNSKNIFDKKIKKYLDSNEINYSIFISKKKGDIQNYVLSYKFNKDKNILLLGGDGTLFEIFQGLKNYNTDEFNIYITPTGSGNAIYTSFDKPQFNSCKINKNSQLLLSNFEMNDEKGLFGLGISIGLISDVDLNTEWMRYIGNTRYDLGGIYYILNTPSYKLKIEYTNNKNENKTIVNDFTQLFIFKCSHCSDNMLLNPDQKMSEDNYTLIAIPNTLTKYELLKLFINLSSDYSPYYDNNKIIIDKVKSFVITPLDEKSKNSLTIDGEKYNFNYPLKGNISNKKINIY
jgi:sphingosine kinase